MLRDEKSDSFSYKPVKGLQQKSRFMLMPSKKTIVPLGLLLIGGIIILSTFLFMNSINWIPVRFPLESGTFHSPAFTVDLETNYDIELEVERKLPFEQINSLLGLDVFLSNVEKRGDVSVVDINWLLYSDGYIVGSGKSKDYRGGGWGTTISRRIGSVDLKKGRNYTIEINSLRDTSILTPTDPRITVSTDREGYLFLSSFLVAAGLICEGIGIIILVIRILPIRNSLGQTMRTLLRRG